MVKKKVVEEPEPVIKAPDPAPKLEHLKQLLQKTEQKNEFQFSNVFFTVDLPMLNYLFRILMKSSVNKINEIRDEICKGESEVINQVRNYSLFKIKII